MTEKAKENSFDYIRAVSTVGIVLFHNSYNYIEYGIGGSHISFLKFGNGDWGGMFVAVFFMLSGAVLWYNYGEHIKTGEFYIKRWLSIFPMFYVAWAVQYYRNVQKYGTWLWGGPRKQFLWTFFGMDGYFMHRGLNYYCLGEWFLGAIILLYLLFPLIRLLYRSHAARIITTVILFFCYTINLYKDLFVISDGKNLLTCLMDFWIGMLLVTYRDRLKNKKAALAALAAAVFFMIAPIPIHEVMCSTVVGACVFVVLMNCAVSNVFVRAVSKYSFGIFLVHHVILYAFMEQYQGMEIGMGKSILLFLFLLIVIILVGALLTETVGFFTGHVRRFLFERKKENAQS